MCFRRKGAKMAKPPKRVKVILGEKPTGDLRKWLKKQEKLRRTLIDKYVAAEDARRLEEALKKKRPNAK